MTQRSIATEDGPESNVSTDEFTMLGERVGCRGEGQRRRLEMRDGGRVTEVESVAGEHAGDVSECLALTDTALGQHGFTELGERHLEHERGGAGRRSWRQRPGLAIEARELREIEILGEAGQTLARLRPGPRVECERSRSGVLDRARGHRCLAARLFGR